MRTDDLHQTREAVRDNYVLVERRWLTLMSVAVIALMLFALSNTITNIVNLAREARYNRLTQSRGALLRWLAETERARGLTPEQEAQLRQLTQAAELPH